MLRHSTFHDRSDSDVTRQAGIILRLQEHRFVIRTVNTVAQLTVTRSDWTVHILSGRHIIMALQAESPTSFNKQVLMRTLVGVVAVQTGFFSRGMRVGQPLGRVFVTLKTELWPSLNQSHRRLARMRRIPLVAGRTISLGDRGMNRLALTEACMAIRRHATISRPRRAHPQGNEQQACEEQAITH
jgi:hypothetical protein